MNDLAFPIALNKCGASVLPVISLSERVSINGLKILLGLPVRLPLASWRVVL
jgi:hypothetical protein